MKIPSDIADRYADPDQPERFDAGVRKVFSLSPQMAEQIRKPADLIKNPKGRPLNAGPSPSHVPVVPPWA